MSTTGRHHSHRGKDDPGPDGRKRRGCRPPDENGLSSRISLISPAPDTPGQVSASLQWGERHIKVYTNSPSFLRSFIRGNISSFHNPGQRRGAGVNPVPCVSFVLTGTDISNDPLFISNALSPFPPPSLPFRLLRLLPCQRCSPGCPYWRPSRRQRLERTPAVVWLQQPWSSEDQALFALPTGRSTVLVARAVSIIAPTSQRRVSGTEPGRETGVLGRKARRAPLPGLIALIITCLPQRWLSASLPCPKSDRQVYAPHKGICKSNMIN